MAKFKKLTAGDGGWSDWQAPVQGYKMACCDCGLVHDVEFQVLKITKDDGLDFSGKEMPWGKYRIVLRARRNNRSTGQLRRHKD
jgi:hypothetical protein